MKKHISLLLLVLPLLIFTNFQCEKKETETDVQLSGCVKGRLVVKGPCAQYAIQVLSGDTANVPVQNNWTDPDTGTFYSNVFTVKNYCSFPDVAVGHEFWFYVIQEKKILACLVCAAVRAVPPVSNEIKYTGATCP